MQFIDTHSHIFLSEFDNDRSEAIERAVNAGIGKIVLPNVDSSTIDLLFNCTALNSNVCLAAIGLHPCSVKAEYPVELKKHELALKERDCIAIGEIGIDLYWDKSFFEEQKKALEIQIQWALTMKLPVILHCRDSFEETFAIVKKYPQLCGVFHAFSGNEEQAKRAIDIGFYIGIGGVVTFKNGGLDKIVAQLPIQSIVLETDAPYLAPVPHRGKRNEPAYILIVANKIAQLLNMPVSEVAAITTYNANKLFKLVN